MGVKDPISYTSSPILLGFVGACALSALVSGALFYRLGKAQSVSDVVPLDCQLLEVSLESARLERDICLSANPIVLDAQIPPSITFTNQDGLWHYVLAYPPLGDQSARLVLTDGIHQVALDIQGQSGQASGALVLPEGFAPTQTILSLNEVPLWRVPWQEGRLLL